MDETLDAVHSSVIHGLGQLTDFFGFSPVMGHLYGALLMSPEPLSLDELEEIVGKSKASVSMNMRALERWGMVREAWVKGDRRKYYEAEADLWKVARGVIESRERREVEVALEVLGDNAQKLKEATPDLAEDERDLAEYYLERVEDMQEVFQVAALVLELFLKRGGAFRVDEIMAAYNSTSEAD